MLHSSIATGTPTVWNPILSGDLAVLARDAVREIVDDIDRRRDGIGERAITDLALVYGVLAHSQQSETWLEKTSHSLNRVVEQASNGHVTRFNLYGGLSGVGWTMTYLSSLLASNDPESDPHSADSIDDDPVASIDSALVRRLQHGWSREYDLISGVTGFAVYFLERLPRPAARRGLQYIIDNVETYAESNADGITWHTPAEMLPEWQRERAPHGYYNLGVAHGIPGIVYVLGELVREQIELPRVTRLLEGAVTWMLSKRQGTPSLFPSWFVPGMQPEVSRLGWCYGDLGVGAVLHVVATRLGRPDWLDAAREILDGCTRFPEEHAHIRDTGLCHGACGVAHIFNRVYQTDPLPQYADAAVTWYRHALDMRRPGEGYGGFPAHVGEESAQADSDASFLAGSFGVALAFLAATTHTEPGWDRLLLLSGRQA